MNEEKIKENIRKMIEHCKNITLRLVRLSKDQKVIEGVASGFIIEKENEYYLISAGHALEENGWVIETDLSIDSECVTACIPVNWPWTIQKFTIGENTPEDIDFAWAKIDINSFKETVQKDKRLKGKLFNLNIYNGPLKDSPDPQMPYSYASLNRVIIIDALGKKVLERDISYEVEMFYQGIRDDGLYIFSIPEHKGHDYYIGASGSPIVEPSGKIVSILLKGCESKNELFGLPLAKFIELISISRDVEQQDEH